MTSIQSVLIAGGMGLVVLLVGGAGCSMLSTAESGPDPETGVAAVDSIDAPDRIASSDTLRVRFYGTVGPNGCYAFDGFETERNGRGLTITPVVQYRGMAIVPLDETYRAAPPFEEGPLTVTVPQPDGVDVTTTVTVSRDAE